MKTPETGWTSSFEDIEQEVEVEAREFARKLLQQRLQERAGSSLARLSPLGRKAGAGRRAAKAKVAKPSRGD